MISTTATIILSSSIPYRLMPNQHYLALNMTKPIGLCLKLCANLAQESYENSPDPIADFSLDLVRIMSQTIPKSSPSSSKTKPKKTWFNDACKRAINNKKNALRAFFANLDNAHLLEYKRLRAVAKRIIKQAKKASWYSFVSTVNNRTSLKTAWDVVRKIEGKTQNNHFHILSQLQAISLVKRTSPIQ